MSAEPPSLKKGVCPKNKLSFELVSSDRSIEDLVFLAERAHSESRFSYISFAPEKVRAIAKRALNDPKRHAIMMCRRDSAPIGFLYCSVGEYHIGTGTLLTTVHNLNILREIRNTLLGGRVSLSLLRGVYTWSQSRAAAEILFHVTSDVEIPRTHKLMKRLGYQFIGGNYSKSVS